MATRALSGLPSGKSLSFVAFYAFATFVMGLKSGSWATKRVRTDASTMLYELGLIEANITAHFDSVSPEWYGELAASAVRPFASVLLGTTRAGIKIGAAYPGVVDASYPVLVGSLYAIVGVWLYLFARRVGLFRRLG